MGVLNSLDMTPNMTLTPRCGATSCLKPTAWEAELADLRGYAEALATRFEGFQKGLAIGLQAISERLDDLGGELNGTPLRGFYDQFKCSCGSAGYLAVHLKCTACMKEDWYGHWPEKQS